MAGRARAIGVPLDGYRPDWLTGLPALTAAHGERVRALVGRRLTRTWLMWEHTEDEWFADGPVLLDFDGEQLEVNHQKFDELSLTWNTIDPSRAPIGPGETTFRLTWRDEVPADLVALVGQTVQSAELRPWVGPSTGHPCRQSAQGPEPGRLEV